MNNYKLIIQYDGTEYAGWQYQENALTIQQKIVEAIKVLIDEEVNLIGSGRTDAGVHALAQAANFKTDKEIDLFKFKYSLNSILPKDISVIDMQDVPNDFHARFNAKKRTYIYLISKYKSPFFNKYSYFYHYDLAFEKLNQLSKSFWGEHDFTSFSKKNSETENKICNVYQTHWRETKGLLIFLIEADRFLHGMVRTIVGTLINAAKNNFDAEYIKDIFEARDRESAGESVPAKGLFLYKVKY